MAKPSENNQNGLDKGSVIPEDDGRIPVFRLFQKVQCRTELWMSKQALEDLELICEKEQRQSLAKCLKKLQTFAQGGFADFEGEENSAIRHEKGATYRVRYKQSSLTRVIGFYEDSTKRVFFALAAIYKHKGNKYTGKQRSVIADIDEVRKSDGWKRAK